MEPWMGVTALVIIVATALGHGIRWAILRSRHEM